MTHADKVYIDTCRDILQNGVSDENLAVRPHWDDGAPAHTIKKFGIVNRYDLREEFPIQTIRRIFWKSSLDEILWIYQKKSNRVAELSSHVWDQWADNEGTIGKAYGYQMGVKHRVGGIDLDKAIEKFGSNGVEVVDVDKANFLYLLKHGSWTDKHCLARKVHGKPSEFWMDQVDHVLYDLAYNPASRRIMTTSWNPEDDTDMGLSPCAYSMTYNVTGNTLNAILNQRSQDMLAAGGWNVTQYALLLKMMAEASGLEAGELVHVIADCHIYDRHIPMIEELIERDGSDAPTLEFNPASRDFYSFSRDDFKLIGYEPESWEEKIPVAV